MSIKPSLLPLAALTLCCIISLHVNSSLGFTRSSYRCLCKRTFDAWIPPRFIQKVEVIAPGGRCRQTEIIVTLKKGNRRICISPQAKWIDKFFRESQALQKSTTTSPSAP